MNILKRSFAMILVLCMLFSAVPFSAFATNELQQPEGSLTDAVEDNSVADAIALDEVDLEEFAQTDDTFYRILHLDCGRKYFTKDWIIALINEMAAAGYNQLQLAFGNDGLRFLLDDMSVNGYSGEAVKAGIQQGNKNYYDAGDKNELTQSEMTEIITYANSKGIAIVPHVNMPGHMDALVDAIEYVGISNAHFTGYSTSKSSLNLNNDAAVSFTKALLEKYVNFFKSQGCSFFHIGADEYGNDAYGDSMGFPNIGADLYTKFAAFVNDCAAIVKDAGMTPRAWNDGINYGKNTGYSPSYDLAFDTDIQVTYWSCGWGSGYAPASAATLRSDGHAMINTHGDYYYILGMSDVWDTDGYTYASRWSNTSFYGSTVSDPAGSMFCIWCDYPGAESETQIAANTRMVLRAMAAEMQGLDGTAVSDEVISGGFNADGTIAESCNNVTVRDDATNVEVTGCDLTHVEVAVAEAPDIADTAAVQAWEITPYVGTEKFIGSATVSLPVPAEWNSSLVKGFYVENGEAILVDGTYADGFYTFKMPHFSVGGVMLLDETAVFDQLIELEVGESYEILIKNVDYDGEYATTIPGVATVVAEYKAGEGTTETPVTSVAAGESYYLKNDAGLYLKADATFTSNIAEAIKWTLETSANGYMIHNGNNQYLFYEGGWILFEGWGDDFKFSSGKLIDYYVATQSLIPVSGGGSVEQSTIIFTGIGPGTTLATVGNTIYKIVVTGQVEITIKYQTESGTVIKTETVNVADNATAYNVSNFNLNGKYYTVADHVLTIDPKNDTEYEVIVTEAEEDLNLVDDLVIEYWQTNAVVVETRGGTDRSKSVKAADAYFETGIELSTIIPVNAYKKDGSASDPNLGYWRSRLLDLATNEQTEANGDDETLNGTGFTRVRYWNGTWAVYTDANNWLDIVPANYQLVAYYMNDMHMADEVSVSTADWGKKGNGEFGGTYLGSSNVSLAFQVVYEGGTTAPGGTGVELAPYTYFVDHWGNRGVGSIGINQIGDYMIWKITAETGEHDIIHNGNDNPVTVNGFTWDNNEMTVWEDAENPVGHYTIQNPSSNPNSQGYYDNLRWNEVNESILIRIYIKAVETDDSLKVIYYDEKFGDTLVEYNVIVPDGSNFNNSIVRANTQTPADLPAFEGSATRKNANGYGIVNALGKTQNFRTDLTQVPEAVGKYNNALYTYTGSEVSKDGMTITHFYTINQAVVFPNYVADFGLPIMFELSDIVTKGEETVTSVSVTSKTKYGTLEYFGDSELFVYTPDRIIESLDILSIRLVFDGGETIINNIGVTPATTVYYEESFLTYDDKWGTIPARPSTPQRTEALDQKTNLFGYDDFYADDFQGSNSTQVTTAVNGASASFTFTGTGFELFANCDVGTGYVTLTRAGETKKLYMMDTGLNYGKTEEGKDYEELMPGATVNPEGIFYSIPVITEHNLPHGTYTVTIKKTHKDGESLKIDGIRIFNTLEDSSVFVEDQEDSPVFYELRDVVLTSLGVSGANSSQVFEALPEDTSAIVSHGQLAYANSDNAQTILNDSPKNEVYLHSNQTLTFKVNTKRVVQIGLKAPNGATKYTINGGSEQNMDSSVDMFYPVAAKSDTKHEITVSVKNTGEHILAVTLLKVCDDPDFSFAPLTQEDIAVVMGEIDTTEPDESDPTEPSKPEESDPTEPSKPEESDPVEPSKPEESDPTEPSKPEESDPTDPSKPEESDPTEPSKPEESDPVEPSKPEESDPTEPSKPEETDPTEPSKPEDKPFDPEKVEMPFKDVPKGKWFHAGVAFVYHHELMNGMKEDEFGPSNAMTRAMVVTVLYRLAGSPETEYDAKYSDVPANKYYTDAVNWAAEKGIAFGVGNNKFDPNGDVTREQLATMLYRYSQLMKYDLETEEDLLDFPDFDQVNKWSKDGMKWAVGKGIINGVKNGSKNELQPGSSALRSQIAVILQRFCEQYR